MREYGIKLRLFKSGVYASIQGSVDPRYSVINLVLLLGVACCHLLYHGKDFLLAL